MPAPQVRLFAAAALLVTVGCISTACGDSEPSSAQGPGGDPGGDGASDAQGSDGAANDADSGPVGEVSIPSKCGASPTWVPTHYVTPTASGSGDGSMANPWSLTQAMAQAVSGNVVRVGPGIYTAPPSGNRYTPAFNPANSGTPTAPIVFVAEHPAVYSALDARSELRNTSVATDGGSPTFGTNGGRHDVIWDGFYVDEAHAHSAADTGPVVVWDSQRIALCRNVIKGEPTNRQDNHTGFRFEVASDSEAVGNEVFDFRVADVGVSPGWDQNYAAIMAYETDRILVANNYFHDNGTDVFIKGWHDVGPSNSGWVVRFNRFERARQVSIQLAYVNPVAGNPRTTISNNLLVDAELGLFPHNGYDSDRAPSDFDFENNTVVNSKSAFLAVYSATVGHLGLMNANVRRNLVVGGPLGYYFSEISGDSLQLFKTRGFDLNDNHFAGQPVVASVGNPNGGPYATPSSFAAGTTFGMAGTGFERDGSQGDPLFVNAAAGDYHLGVGSPARTAAMNGGAVGCYVTGTETIGIP